MTDFEPSARVILDSITAYGNRLTTIEVKFHRFMLAEMNTHRVFSRNSASSRAIPASKTIARLVEETALPLHWPFEQPGMQGGPELDEHQSKQARDIWLSARNAAVKHAKELIYLGVHKSVVNRLLEPFMTHTAIITATDWQGFWAQRCHEVGPQAEIRDAARAMKVAYDASEPGHMNYGNYHMPYITDEDRDEHMPWTLRQISVARCARVSYLTHAGVRDAEKDIELYQRLISAEPAHASPLEHVATPTEPGESPFGNFRGWRQLRHEVLGY